MLQLVNLIKRFKQDERGVSFVDTILSVTVLAILVVSLTSIHSSVTRFSERNEQLFQAQTLVQDKALELYQADVSTWPNGTSEILSDFPSVSCTYNVTPAPSPLDTNKLELSCEVVTPLENETITRIIEKL